MQNIVDEEAHCGDSDAPDHSFQGVGVEVGRNYCRHVQAEGNGYHHVRNTDNTPNEDGLVALYEDGLVALYMAGRVDSHSPPNDYSRIDVVHNRELECDVVAAEGNTGKMRMHFEVG